MLHLFGRPYFSGNVISGIPPLPQKAYALLAVLKLSCKNSASRSLVAGILWENVAPAKATANLRQLIAQIRRWEKTYECRLIQANRDSITRSTGMLSTDLDRFLDITAIPDREALIELATLYRDDLLVDISSNSPGLETFLITERAYLQERFISLALSGVATIGKEPFTGDVLQKLHQINPFDERIVRALLHYTEQEKGKAAAIRLYTDYSARIKTELGVSPEAQTKAIAEKLTEHSVQEMSAKPRRDSVYKKRWSLGGESRNALPRILVSAPELVPPGCRLPGVGNFADDLRAALSEKKSLVVLAPQQANSQHKFSPDLVTDFYEADYVLSLNVLSLEDGKNGHLRLEAQLTGTRNWQLHWRQELVLTGRRTNQGCRFESARAAAQIYENIARAELSLFRNSTNPSAYIFYLLGCEQLDFNLPAIRRARKLFRRASDLVPAFCAAQSMMARTLTMEWLLLARPEQDLLLESAQIANDAIRMDPYNAAGFRELGHVTQYLGDLDESIAQFKIASLSAPCDADIAADFADALVHNSDFQGAQFQLEKAKEIIHLSPDSYQWTEGALHYFSGHYKQATASLLKMRDQEPAARLLAAAASMQGDTVQAEKFRKIQMETHPDFRIAEWVTVMPQRHNEDIDHYVTGLRTAGFY